MMPQTEISQNREKKSPRQLLRLGRYRSIGTNTGGGLVLIGLLFLAISCIALYGFFSFQKVLNEQSRITFPRATRNAQISILLGQLAQQAEQLHSAEIHAQRRIAYNLITNQLFRLNEFLPDVPLRNNDRHWPELQLLTTSLEELNNLVAARIETGKQIDHIEESLQASYMAFHKTGNQLSELAETEEQRQWVDKFVEEGTTLITETMRFDRPDSLRTFQKRIHQVKKHLNSLVHLATIFPLPLAETASKIVTKLQGEIAGTAGLLSLLSKYRTLSNQSEARILLARKSMEERGNITIGEFFRLTTSMGKETQHLAESGRTLIGLLATLLFSALTLAGFFFYYYRKILIDRLARLNRSVLSMVAGDDIRIEDHGWDEITEIAHSINYFSSELHKARKEAEKSALATTAFLAHMSHEIRTPMNGILGFSDLALRTRNPSEHIEYLSKINHASHSLLGIINAILDFSKIEAGKFAIANSLFDLRELLEDLSTLIGLRSEESGVDFHFVIGPDTPCHIVGDQLRLNQVLTNLITNAFKFTRHGHITLHIDTEPGSNNFLRFSVQDSGSGIQPGEAERLFQPYTQADTSITRSAGGTGLGLTISRSLVEMMGGEIWLEDQDDPGATFTFTIRYQINESGTDCFYPVIPELQNKKAMIMSEKPRTATAISLQLSHLGLKTLQTLSLSEVNATLHDESLDTNSDFVLIDCHTLSHQAIVGLHKIITGKRAAFSKTILIGTQQVISQLHTIKELSECDYLEKPVSPARLLACLQGFAKPLSTEARIRLPDTPIFPHKEDARLLLVEDNDINLEIALGYLNRMKLQVSVARNGQEALDFFQKKEPESFELILMDIQMPVLDGYSATRVIRTLPAPICTIPIVALTAHAMQDERRKCLESGMNDYITKPIDPEQLHTVLNQYLKLETIPESQTADTTSLPFPRSAFPNNVGIDIRAGLAQVMGNATLYIDLLSSFVDTYRFYPEQIQKELKALSFAPVLHMLHTLKGVSGNLYIKPLVTLCQELEILIRKKKIQESSQRLSELEHVMARICNFLQQWLDRYRNSGWNTQIEDQTATNREELCTLLKNLDHSLHNNSVRALEQLRQIRSQMGNEDSNVLSRIESLANDLEFKKARELLLQWQPSIAEP